MTKEPFYQKSSFWVFFYAIVMMIVMLLQAALAIIGKAVTAGQITSNFFVGLINANLTMPLEPMSILWISISAAYIGIDRGAYAVKTSTLEYGFSDVGTPAVLRQIILISGLMFIEGIVLNAVCTANFYLPELASAFGSTVLLYVTGQKAIKIAKYVGSGPDATAEQLATAQGTATTTTTTTTTESTSNVTEQDASELVSTLAADSTTVDAAKEAASIVVKDVKDIIANN